MPNKKLDFYAPPAFNAPVSGKTIRFFRKQFMGLVLRKLGKYSHWTGKEFSQYIVTQYRRLLDRFALVEMTFESHSRSPKTKLFNEKSRSSSNYG